MKFIKLTALLLLTAALPTATHDRVGVELTEPIISVPMNTAESHIGLEIYLGDEGPFWFNLDTYAVTTACIDASFAEEMGYEKVGTTQNGDGSGEVRTRDVVLIPDLRLGGATFTNIRALADDYSFLENAESGRVCGLLGYYLFRDLLLEVDYPNERVVLQRGKLSRDDENVITHKALRDRPDIPIRIGDEEMIVGIDTGAQSGLSIPFALMDKFDLATEPEKVGVAQTVYNSAPIWVGQMAEPLHIAGHKIEGYSGTFSELFGKALLGHQILKEFSVTFDQKRGRVRFVTGEREAGPESTAK